jgi:hypothetical protein
MLETRVVGVGRAMVRDVFWAKGYYLVELHTCDFWPSD